MSWDYILIVACVAMALFADAISLLLFPLKG